MLKPLFLLSAQVCMLFTLAAGTAVTHADEPFIGEVRWFAGNFAPRGWSFCDGQLLAITTNEALFSLLGTSYGGDGRTTFGLPDMRGRGMVHAGSGPGLTNRRLGQKGGSETVTLTENELPVHTHTLSADSSGGDSVMPDGRVISKVGRLRVFNNAPDSDMGSTAITSTGAGQAHNNVQPSIALNCIIALQGIYPSRY